MDWWGGPERTGRRKTERAWQVTAEEVKARGYNLDIKNPHTAEDAPGDPEELLTYLTATESETATLRDQLKTVLGTAAMNTDQLLAHFTQVADAPDAIPRLRQFILDLAVRGKLVPQDPNDEPASELLKRVKKEKARLVKAKKIRKPKKLPIIDEIPYPIPHLWLWTRIREITSDRGQCKPEAAFTYIDVATIDKENGTIVEPKVIQADEAPSRARKIVCKGDVIYSCVRPYLLNVAIVSEGFDPKPIASTAFAVLNGYGLVLSQYLWIVLRSPFMIACVEKDMRGQAYPAINDADFSILPFPLPTPRRTTSHRRQSG